MGFFSNTRKYFTKKIHLLILNDSSFEEKYSLSFSRFRLYFLILFFILLIASLVYLTIAYTPLKRFVIPGYSTEKENLQEQIDETKKLISELEKKHLQEVWWRKNLQDLGNGKISIQKIDSILKDSNIDYSNIKFENTIEDSLLSEKVNDREAFEIQEVSEKTTLDGYNLYPPVKGEISKHFNASKGHYGVDIIAPKNEIINSVLSGTIIFSDWTEHDGYVIHIQHKNNMISVYKHNSSLMKQTGDVVTVGEAIAVIGNTGKSSEGEHLHFELWVNGVPFNPENYFTFE